ncbi:NUDIX domain-containing protein [Microbacterium sp. No. 7]|uniref:NUDIX domain-containing protein n=1 Tax=Microbacterium sp. No. 7 TaxID=1714373 RepID=UPI0006D0EEDB|nr:NUDIX domain-containing protein [Microbacterium sp. No. 7]ALJ21243.1 hypothetical protein AOA12_15570 [Microbacterium sp. No. 7]
MTEGDLRYAATAVLLRASRGRIETLMLERPDRGNFAGMWVFPGGKIDAEDAGDDLVERARSAAVRETREEVALELDPDELLLQARWTPAADRPLRFRTWFFLARDPGGPIATDPGEVVDAAWLRPADALERHAAGGLLLAPPTWVTLHTLARHDDIDDLLEATRARGVRHFDTHLHGQILLWEGDGEYPGGDGGPRRHRFDRSSLPWAYIADD